ncbi:MAG: serine/threonine protein kinase [Gemmatimonadota bacterium]|nr:MAG: serine/threonine protein kinase [Gemmatimonadota bacterium]
MSAGQVRHAARRRPPLVEGAEIGAYRLGALLGRGGMGEVYQATHRLLGTPAAIKLIRPEVLIRADDDDLFLTLRRFRREAETGSRLRSPHAVRLYDFGMTDGGTFYIVMELLAGLDLARLVDRFGPVPAERTLHFLRQACSALDEMHAHGLVHRDLKPENLHVCRRELHHDFLKVTDLGLVKPARGATAEHLALRARGRVLGTPAYMAPEIARGEAGDERTDIYALGCVAYWLLTASPLFEGQSVEQTMRSHLDEDPIPPSRRTELDIPAALERLILWSLAKAPALRPQSVGEFQRRLAACDPPQRWTEERAMRWWDTHSPDGAAEAVKTARPRSA